MSDVSDVIYQAIDLFRGGDGWTQHSDAQNEFGQSVKVTSADAVKFCLRGAVARVCMTAEMEEGRCLCSVCVPITASSMFNMVMGQLDRYCRSRFHIDPVSYNDRSSYEDVVLMMKEVATAIQ
jgi:hypothetical protein